MLAVQLISIVDFKNITVARILLRDGTFHGLWYTQKSLKTFKQRAKGKDT